MGIPVFFSAIIELSLITNCSDSAFFIQSAAQELYKVYTDSLKAAFETAYRAKCLQAYKLEKFTVTHAVSEFHYTLYYYDQAGNLVKTIPPKGVNPNRNTTWLAEVKAKRLANQFQVPAHVLATDYRYNTLNQSVAQQTPDAGQSQFWYDRLGRLTLSQNARQKAAGSSAVGRLYSYTRYDYLGRITEVGQLKDLSGNTVVNDTLTRNPSSLQAWMNDRDLYRDQITTTVYDQPYTGYAGIDMRLILQQRNLRNRVSYLSYTDTAGSAAFNNATLYSYDIHGNVDTLLQDYGSSDNAPNLMNKNVNRFKKLVYQYDLISGKVNQTAYQQGWSDQVFHRYQYDAENRLTQAQTSFDGLRWEQDAAYEYYRHGPLARMILGDQRVQGIDYAYTLQGWLKGVNSSALDSLHDMGQDGLYAGANQYVARDAVGFNLNYYDTADYAPINAGINPFPSTMAYLAAANYRPLFNGNISSMAVNNRALNTDKTIGGALLLYTYRYDQLNRLTAMDAYNGFNRNANTWNGIVPLNFFRERITYDPNGNIAGYLRNGHKTPYAMDSLTYRYLANTNKLSYVKDSVSANRYGPDPGDVVDIDNQAPGNYDYDQTGNLIRDNAESITSIRWSVYGKILEINRTPGVNNPIEQIAYTYDAQGNRISKMIRNSSGKTYTWYARDAQGNTMAAYQSAGNTQNLEDLPLTLRESMLYGSARLGSYTHDRSVDGGPADMRDSMMIRYRRGNRQYELTNHLGNVLATVSDKKKGVDIGSNGIVDYYDADIITAQDYYPFGMLMPGRSGYQSQGGWADGPGSGSSSLPADLSVILRENNQPPEYVATRSVELNPGFESGEGDAFSAYISEDDGGGFGGGSGGGEGLYRYGFNGKENDNEVKGIGNQQDYGMRIYDPRLGRFLSVDPLTKGFAMLTPYQYASNSPLSHIDLDGEEGIWYIYAKSGVYGPTVAKIVNGTEDGVKASVTNTWNFFSSDMWKGETWKQTGLFLEEAALGMSTVKVYETPRVDAAVKRFEDNVINGDAYSRSKYISEFSTDVITGYLSSKGLGNIKSFVANTVKTDWAIAKQSMSVGALSAATKTKSGATLYRIGTTGVSAEGKAAQFWSLENPLSDPEGYAKKYNVPLENIKGANFIETAKLKKGSNFITREAGDAPGSTNSGKGIEVVIDKGGTTNNIINPIKKE